MKPDRANVRVFVSASIAAVRFCVLTAVTISSQAESSVVVVPLAGQEITVTTAGQVDRDTRPASNFRISAGVVTDLTTRLVWQQQRSSDKMEWPQADNYCADLEVVTPNGTLADWRLPTLPEWTTLLRFGDTQLLDSAVFPNSNHTYWTSTYSASDVAPGSSTPTSLWAVSIDGTHIEGLFGRTSMLEINNEHHVRCVRLYYD